MTAIAAMRPTWSSSAPWRMFQKMEKMPKAVTRFVPHLGWTRGFARTMSGRSSSPASIAWTTWCSAAWKPLTHESRKRTANGRKST